VSVTCPRCGVEAPALEVRNMAGETILVEAVCSCPRPRCPFCGTSLAADGSCRDPDCFLVGHLVPVPELR
jgi:hypothetical protein